MRVLRLRYSSELKGNGRIVRVQEAKIQVIQFNVWDTQLHCQAPSGGPLSGQKIPVGNLGGGKSRGEFDLNVHGVIIV